MASRTIPAVLPHRPQTLPALRRLPGILLDASLWLALAFMVWLAAGTFGNPWYRVIALHGESMAPTLRRGDALVVTPPPAGLRPGMILVLRVGSELVTHRLIAVAPDGRLITQGDANPCPDRWAHEPIPVAVYRFRIPHLGGLITAGHQALTGLAPSIHTVAKPSPLGALRPLR